MLMPKGNIVHIRTLQNNIVPERVLNLLGDSVKLLAVGTARVTQVKSKNWQKNPEAKLKCRSRKIATLKIGYTTAVL